MKRGLYFLFLNLIISFVLTYESFSIQNDLFQPFLIQNENYIDLHRFTQVLSTHLLFDHFDKAYMQLSRKISLQFRDAIHVRVKKVNSSFETRTLIPPPVDIQILKRQLKGAVGSFIEDKLPNLLTNRHNTTRLQHHLDQLILEYCPLTISSFEKKVVSYSCLFNHQKQFLDQIHTYTTKELQHTLFTVNKIDLPRLFEKTRAQIAGIIVHFNRHTLDTDYHQLELKIKTTYNTSNATTHLNHSNNPRVWITPDMVEDFLKTVKHSEEDEEHTIKHFMDLSVW